jgi:hypothetical protein
MDKSLLETSTERRQPLRSLRRIGRLDRPPEAKAPDTNANVRAAGFAMLIAFALMALFNSGGLRSFTRDLPGNWLTDELVMRADQWHELMVALGPAQARPAVRNLFDSFREITTDDYEFKFEAPALTLDEAKRGSGLQLSNFLLWARAAFYCLRFVITGGSGVWFVDAQTEFDVSLKLDNGLRIFAYRHLPIYIASSRIQIQPNKFRIHQ